jgi:hypothetical protein
VASFAPGTRRAAWAGVGRPVTRAYSSIGSASNSAALRPVSATRKAATISMSLVMRSPVGLVVLDQVSGQEAQQLSPGHVKPVGDADQLAMRTSASASHVGRYAVTRVMLGSVLNAIHGPVRLGSNTSLTAKTVTIR